MLTIGLRSEAKTAKLNRAEWLERQNPQRGGAKWDSSPSKAKTRISVIKSLGNAVRRRVE